MMLIPEDLGNAVKIKNKIVPAVNIQTEVTPDYTVYFEILFEDGGLWICYFEHYDPDNVYVEMYYDWAHNTNLITDPDVVWRYDSWTGFLTTYDDWTSRHPGAFVNRHWVFEEY